LARAALGAIAESIVGRGAERRRAKSLHCFESLPAPAQAGLLGQQKFS
jgi:hypothetical protein